MTKLLSMFISMFMEKLMKGARFFYIEIKRPSFPTYFKFRQEPLPEVIFS